MFWPFGKKKSSALEEVPKTGSNGSRRPSRDPVRDALAREKIIQQSGIRNIFTPNSSIKKRDFLFGRDDELQQLISNLNSPSVHSVIYGDRGVGKSSLANVVSDLVVNEFQFLNKIIRKSCDSRDTFITIVADILREAEIDVGEQTKRTIERENGLSLGTELSGIPIKVGIGNDTKSISTTRSSDATNAHRPAWVAARIAKLPLIVLIDEMERISSEEVKRDLAELIRAVSEEPGTKLKFVLCGIAKTAADLTLGHPSVQRCLRDVRIGRLRESILEEIVERGAAMVGVSFEADAKQHAARMSSGYPYFAHLLALKACEDAIADKRKIIKIEHLVSSTEKAVNDAEGKLRDAYDTAIGDKTSTAQYRKVLLAAAAATATSLTHAQLRHAYKEVWKEDLSTSQLTGYLRRLASDGEDTIFQRIAPGVYQFNDPRMPSFIRIAQFYNEESQKVDIFRTVDVSTAEMSADGTE